MSLKRKACVPVDYMRPKAWAAYCTDGSPGPFIHEGAVHQQREGVIRQMGEAWAVKGETARQGWKRAYRNGWRAVRVQIIPDLRS